MYFKLLKQIIDSYIENNHQNYQNNQNQKSLDLLVTGGPGTGKTFLLIDTIAYLINQKKIRTDSILVFCFNRRWARIIREKVAQKVRQSFFEVPINSFFSFCLDFLKENYYLLDDIKLLNAPQQWTLLKEIIKNNLNPKNYPLTFKYINTNKFIEKSFMQEVFDFILRAQENLINPIDILNNINPEFEPTTAELAGIYLKYNQFLKQNNLFNYGRLLFDTVDILKTNDDIRKSLVEKFDFIIVDEFNEINRAQYEIIKLISNNNCIYFGNSYESVFSFRGSLNDIFSNTFNKLKVNKENEKSLLLDSAVVLNKSVIILTQNFRSNSLICDLCNEFISLNKLKNKDELFLSKSFLDIQSNIKESVSEGIFIKDFPNLIDEITFICIQIKSLVLVENIKPENICILVKGLGYKIKLLESMLNQNNIPFVRRGTRTILDNPYVQYLLNISQLIILLKEIKQKEKQIDNELRIKIKDLLVDILISEFLNISPVYVLSNLDGILKGLLNNISNISSYAFNPVINKTSISISKTNEIDLNQAKIDLNQANINLIQAVITKFLEAIIFYTSFDVSKNKYNAYDFLLNIFTDKRFKIIESLFNCKTSIHKNYKIHDNLSNSKIVGDFFKSVWDFVNENAKNSSLEHFINFISELSESSFLEEIEESAKETSVVGSINILSFHQSKGLEFEAVFIPFINKNYLPTDYKEPQLYNFQLFNYLKEGKKYLPEISKKIHLEEERNLLYVGLSRAKNHLYITSCKSEEKSQFFEELKDIFKNLKKQNFKKEQNLCDDKQFKDIYFFSTQNWLLRKKALIGLYRKEENKFINEDKFLNKIILLKNIYPPEKWWINRFQTLNRLNPFKHYQNDYSYSLFYTFKNCPMKFKYKYFFRIQEPQTPALLIGKIYHEILSTFFNLLNLSNLPNLTNLQNLPNLSNLYGFSDSSKNEKSKNDNSVLEDFTLDRLKKIIKQVIDKYNFDWAFYKEEILSNAVKNFEKFYDLYVKDRKFVGFVEKSFSFKLKNNLINGRIDHINFIDEKTVELIDYKSGSRSISQKDLQKDIQLPLYKLAINLSKDLDMLKGKNVILKYIFLGDKNCSQLIFNDEDLDFNNFIKLIIEIIKEINKENFLETSKNSFECRNCSFRINCSRFL